MGGIGSIAAGAFGIIWTIGASSMGAPPFFMLFGVLFVVIAIVQAIYHFKNATSRNRMSLFDITDREPDPLDDYFGGKQSHSKEERRLYDEDIQFCPYCGTRVADSSFNFCPKCGKEIREVTG
jgi:Formamidopyrimidine-DNA glycosylase